MLIFTALSLKRGMLLELNGAPFWLARWGEQSNIVQPTPAMSNGLNRVDSWHHSLSCSAASGLTVTDQSKNFKMFEMFDMFDTWSYI